MKRRNKISKEGIKKLFVCSNKECDYYFKEGDELYMLNYMDNQYDLWCPCCKYKMIRVE